MPYDPLIHHRRSIRLKGYDYTRPGAYFVTINVAERECIFGEVKEGRMILSRFGKIVQGAWLELPNHYPHIRLDAFCIMPDHVHGIIVLTGDDDTGGQGAPRHRAIKQPNTRHGLPEIVRAFKAFSARRINRARRTPGVAVWHRNYYEHIIRDEADVE